MGRSNQAIFDDVYKKHRWGTNTDHGASSGKGSLSENTEEYEKFIAGYIKQYNIKSMLDIGCGDFQVSRRILHALDVQIVYLGADVSQVIIDRNKAAYENETTKFVQLDATKEDIPSAELITIREVLQHLPNKDIERVLSHLIDRHKNAHILVTNTVARNPEKINIDIPAGSASRAGIGSGLSIDRPPFSYRVEELLKVPHANHKTIIITSRLLGKI